MAYDRAMDIVRLAIRLQGTASGLTLGDIQREFEISRRTAERLRSAVEDLFGPLETVSTGRPSVIAGCARPPYAAWSHCRRMSWWSSWPPPRLWSARACRNARSCCAVSTTSCAPYWSRRR